MSSPLDRLSQLAARRVGELPSRRRLDWITHHNIFRLADCETLDPALRAQISAKEREVEARNRMLIWRCQDLLEVLEVVDVVPLKGIYFLDNIYADSLGSRVLSDIDLLIPGDQLEEALTRLSSQLGYRETDSSRASRSFYPHCRLVGDGLPLELHTKLAVKFIGLSDWTALSPVTAEFFGRKVHVLDDETNLVYMVCHFVKHGPFYCLKWVADILLWLEQRRPDPILTLERARALHAEVAFVAGIRVVRALLGGSCFPGFANQAESARHQRRIQICEAAVWRGAVRDPMNTAAADSSWRRNLAALLLADDGRESARFLGLKARELMRRTLR